MTRTVKHHRRFSSGLNTREKSNHPPRAILGVGHIVIIASAITVLLFLCYPVKAEAFHILWADSFCTEGNWTVTPEQFIDETPPCALWQTANVQSWQGPTYRTVATSTWNDATDPVLRLDVQVLGPHGDNEDDQQFNFRLGASHSDADLNGPGSGELDYFEVRLVRTPTPHTMRWMVVVKDEGQRQFFNHSIDDTTDLDLYANITINTVAHRYWINWSAGEFAGSNTSAWTDVVDGPFAESSAMHLNLWSYTYSSCFCTQWRLGGITLWGANLTVQPGSSSPQEPPRNRKVAANFYWVQTLLGTQFFDSSEGSGEIVSWAWEFGDGNKSQKQDPFHIYTCKGVFEVTLTVQDQNGQVGSIRADLTIEEDRLTCNVVARTEQGLTISAFGNSLSLSTGMLLLLLLLSGMSLLGDSRANPQPLVSRKLRWALFLISLGMLLLTSGVIGALMAGGRV